MRFPPYVAGLCFGIYTLVISLAILVCALVAPGRRLYMPLGRVWARWTLATAGIRLHVEGARPCYPQPVVFMPNHGSLLDAVVLPLILPDNTRFIAKRALSWVPIFGWAMRLTRACLFIDRSDRGAAIATLGSAAAFGGEGDCILIFPEGGRHRGDGLGAFKRGPFHLARQMGVPIVPIGIRGARELMASGQLEMRSGCIAVSFGAPLDPLDGTVDELSDRVRAQLQVATLGSSTMG